MRTFAVAVLAATFAVPALSVAGDQPGNSAPKPTSFVPHSHSSSHVYGSPIGQPIVGHAKTSHHKLAPKKQPRAISSLAPSKHRAK
jgi:hypothetical protein